MGEMKKNISLHLLFQNLPIELQYMYKNILKLEFNEKPDYRLFIILFENILRNLKVSLNINNNTFCFVLNIKKYLEEKYSSKSAKKIKLRNFLLFKGYPVSYSLALKN